MLGVKKVEPSKYIELGYKKDDDGYFYTKIKDGIEITFEEDGGYILMCKGGSGDYYNSNDTRFNKDLIQDLFDNDLVEEVELTIEEEE